MPESIQAQIVKYLTDVHSIEVQALAQMRKAPDLAGDARLAEIFREHERETEEHERLIRDRLDAVDAAPSTLKDMLGKLTGGAFVLFARSQPDTPGKLVAHAFSYEHMEFAAYELLIRVAARAGDAATIGVARRVSADERRMAERLAASFDVAVDASLRELAPDNIGTQLDKYLADAHAIEAQAIQMLQASKKIGGDPRLDRLYAEHLDETRTQQQLIEQRMRERGASPAAVKDAALRLGALNWGGFFAAQPDTPVKLAGFAFAFEHLEIAAYELLRRVAQRAGDEETAAMAQQIRQQERAAAERIMGSFDVAVEAALRVQGVAAAV
jgi:ferritin-like metal-binding protein YciE